VEADREGVTGNAVGIARRLLPEIAKRPLRRLRRRTQQNGMRPQAPPSPSLWHFLQPYIPDDHARQVTASYYVRKVMASVPQPRRVMDLGCGAGNSVDEFRKHNPDVDWVGVDIADSTEARSRRRTDALFVTYDGLRLPYESDEFDVVYSNHVLEHVRYPDRHLAEIARVLRPGGHLIGITSQLEPFHNVSYWSFTLLGFLALIEEAGLRLEEVRPGMDGVTLTLRAYLGRPDWFDGWVSSESPLNLMIDQWGKQTKRRPALVNLRKLTFCGHFAFQARKP
jgi:SAM-dependent methyltransferase